MLNWLRGKFGKRNNTNTNLTIADDDSDNSITLANRQEDTQNDDGIDSEPDFKSPAELAAILSGTASLEMVRTPETSNESSVIETTNAPQSSGELSGNLKSGRAEAAASKESERKKLTASVLPPTLKQVFDSVPLETPDRMKVAKVEFEKSSKEFEKYKTNLQLIISKALAECDRETANFIVESLNKQGAINELSLTKSRLYAIKLNNFKVSAEVGKILVKIGDLHNEGAKYNSGEL
jgi:hypothetical protein